jgi:hypothetical protein
MAGRCQEEELKGRAGMAPKKRRIGMAPKKRRIGMALKKRRICMAPKKRRIGMAPKSWRNLGEDGGGGGRIMSGRGNKSTSSACSTSSTSRTNFVNQLKVARRMWVRVQTIQLGSAQATLTSVRELLTRGRGYGQQASMRRFTTLVRREPLLPKSQI